MSGARPYPASVKRESAASDPLHDAANALPPPATYAAASVAHIASNSNSSNSNSFGASRRQGGGTPDLSAQYRPAIASDPIEVYTSSFIAECKWELISAAFDVFHMEFLDECYESTYK